MDFWEYKIINFEPIKNRKREWVSILERQLNELGWQGWELVSSSSITDVLSGWALQGGATSNIKLILKRKLKR